MSNRNENSGNSNNSSGQEAPEMQDLGEIWFQSNLDPHCAGGGSKGNEHPQETLMLPRRVSSSQTRMGRKGGHGANRSRKESKGNGVHSDKMKQQQQQRQEEQREDNPFLSSLSGDSDNEEDPGSPSSASRKTASSSRSGKKRKEVSKKPTKKKTGSGGAIKQGSSSFSTTPSESMDGSESQSPRGNKRRKLSEQERQERNRREQERSNKVASQFDELRTLLQAAGVVMPKGTKGSILAVAVDYIKTLQKSESEQEAECKRLKDQIQGIAGGSLGPEAARAICATAVQHEIDMQSLKGSSSSSSSAASSCTNTITSSSTMNHRDQSQSSSVLIEQQQPTEEAHFPPNISNMSNRHYRAAFDHCIVPMAICNLGGTFLDCNQLFYKVTETASKKQLQSMSVFHLTTRGHLSYAFERLNKLLEQECPEGTWSSSGPATTEGSAAAAQPIDVSSTIPNHGLRISRIHPNTDGMESESYSNYGPASRGSHDSAPNNMLLVTLVEMSNGTNPSNPLLSNLNFTLPIIKPPFVPGTNSTATSATQASSSASSRSSSSSSSHEESPVHNNMNDCDMGCAASATTQAPSFCSFIG